MKLDNNDEVLIDVWSILLWFLFYHMPGLARLVLICNPVVYPKVKLVFLFYEIYREKTVGI